MPGFRKARGELLSAYDDNLISEEEFLLLTLLKTLIMINWNMIYRRSHRSCSMKKGVLKNFLKFRKIHRKIPVQESFFNKVTGLTLQLIKKETLAQVFSFEFCKIFKNIFFTEHIRATASGFI